MTRLTPADAVWPLGETRENPMVVSSILWFDRAPDPDRIRALVRERMLAGHPVFRQRLVPPRIVGALPRWVEDAAFDLDRHLVFDRLPAPGDHAVLQRTCEADRERALDPAHPLWRFHVLDGYEDGAAVHVQFHHAIGDGWALVRLLLGMADAAPADEDVVVLDDDPHAGWHLLADAAHEAAAVATHPRQWADLAARTAGRAGWAARLLVPQVLPHTALMGRPGGRKRMVWDPVGIPLTEVKAVGRHFDATINDVLLATVAGAISDHLAASGTPAEESMMMVPVALRQPDGPLPRHLGNRIGLLPVRLPTGEATIAERIACVRELTLELKRSAAPAVSWALLAATAFMTAPVERRFHRLHQVRGTGVITNVPGPRGPVTIAGAQLRGMLGWGGMTGNLNLSWALASVDGRIFSGAVTDAAITPDPQPLLDAQLAQWAAARAHVWACEPAVLASVTTVATSGRHTG